MRVASERRAGELSGVSAVSSVDLRRHDEVERRRRPESFQIVGVAPQELLGARRRRVVERDVPSQKLERRDTISAFAEARRQARVRQRDLGARRQREADAQEADTRTELEHARRPPQRCF